MTHLLDHLLNLVVRVIRTPHHLHQLIKSLLGRLKSHADNWSILYFDQYKGCGILCLVIWSLLGA